MCLFYSCFLRDFSNEMLTVINYFAEGKQLILSELILFCYTSRYFNVGMSVCKLFPHSLLDTCLHVGVFRSKQSSAESVTTKRILFIPGQR